MGEPRGDNAGGYESSRGSQIPDKERQLLSNVAQGLVDAFPVGAGDVEEVIQKGLIKRESNFHGDFLDSMLSKDQIETWQNKMANKLGLEVGSDQFRQAWKEAIAELQSQSSRSKIAGLQEAKRVTREIKRSSDDPMDRSQ